MAAADPAASSMMTTTTPPIATRALTSAVFAESPLHPPSLGTITMGSSSSSSSLSRQRSDSDRVDDIKALLSSSSSSSSSFLMSRDNDDDDDEDNDDSHHEEEDEEEEKDDDDLPSRADEAHRSGALEESALQADLAERNARAMADGLVWTSKKTETMPMPNIQAKEKKKKKTEVSSGKETIPSLSLSLSLSSSSSSSSPHSPTTATAAVPPSPSPSLLRPTVSKSCIDAVGHGGSGGGGNGGGANGGTGINGCFGAGSAKVFAKTAVSPSPSPLPLPSHHFAAASAAGQDNCVEDVLRDLADATYCLERSRDIDATARAVAEAERLARAMCAALACTLKMSGGDVGGVGSEATASDATKNEQVGWTRRNEALALPLATYCSLTRSRFVVGPTNLPRHVSESTVIKEVMEEDEEEEEKEEMKKYNTSDAKCIRRDECGSESVSSSSSSSSPSQSSSPYSPPWDATREALRSVTALALRLGEAAEEAGEAARRSYASASALGVAGGGEAVRRLYDPSLMGGENVEYHCWDGNVPLYDAARDMAHPVATHRDWESDRGRAGRRCRRAISRPVGGGGAAAAAAAAAGRHHRRRRRRHHHQQRRAVDGVGLFRRQGANDPHDIASALLPMIRLSVRTGMELVAMLAAILVLSILAIARGAASVTGRAISRALSCRNDVATMTTTTTTTTMMILEEACAGDDLR